MEKQVLILDKDIEVCKQIKYLLQDETTQVYYTQSVKEALGLFADRAYTMVIMDIAHSETDGMELLRMLHWQKSVPILVLSANCSLREEVEVLNAGADKYLGKPLDLEQCLAYAQSIMRRSMVGIGQGQRSYILASGSGLKIDLLGHRAFWGEKSLDLTPTQYRMICCLAGHIGSVVSKTEVFDAVWDINYDLNVDEAVKYHIKELRRKLGAVGAPKLIETVWGVGYQLITGEERI